MLHTGLLAGLCKDGRMSTTITTARTRVFALFLVIFGALGLLAAFALSNEKIALLKNPTDPLGCNIGVLVKCSTNLDSWQGSVFGFANSFIGLMAWPVVITIGVALLGGVHFPRWFWAGLNVGALGALVFVGWLIYQSIFSLDVLCPWCMLTWSVTIPTFWMVTLRNLRDGIIAAPNPVKQVATRLYGWVPLITLVCYVIVILIAQLQMNAIPRLLLDLRNAWGL